MYPFEESKANPLVSPAQFKLAEAVLSRGTDIGSMTVQTAKELLRKTPAKLEVCLRGVTGSAEKMITSFHGRAPKETVDILETEEYIKD